MLTYHSSQVLQKFFTCVVKWWRVHLLQCFSLNIFYSEEKDWAWHTTRQCPLQDYNVLRRHLLIFNLSAVHPLELLLSLDDADQRNNRELLSMVQVMDFSCENFLSSKAVGIHYVCCVWHTEYSV